MKLTELTLDSPIYLISTEAIRKDGIKAIRREGEQIAVIIKSTGFLYYGSPDDTKINDYCLTLEDAQEEQKILRIKRLDALRKQVEAAVKEYAEAVNKYTFVEANSNIQ